jgi:hypothetical protein
MEIMKHGRKNWKKTLKHGKTSHINELAELKL